MILLSNVQVGVVGACNGLGMLITFFALTTAVVLVLRRGWWERACVGLSAVPIGLLANVVRITATGVLAELLGGEAANLVFHDLAGWLMMPLALGMLWIGYRLFSWAFPLRLAEEEESLDLFGVASSPAPTARSRSPTSSGRARSTSGRSCRGG